jgi:BirA family biotin operon repressor/biotin-[acetyl-CoA-carboxylase] ligase
VDLFLKMKNPWGAPVFVKERTSSTMDDALELARKGYPPGTAVVAGSQERGRGRVPGRRWMDSPWKSLLVSLFFGDGDVGCAETLLPMATAVAVCRAVEQWLSAPGSDDAVYAAALGAAAPAPPRAQIKWPNDVLLDGRKISGILWEKRGGRLVVGIGVNCNQESFPPELSNACSLRQIRGEEVPVFDVCARLLSELKSALRDESWMAELSSRLALRGRRIEARAPGSEGSITGIVEGIDSQGGLILRLPDGGRLTVIQAEILESP